MQRNTNVRGARLIMTKQQLEYFLSAVEFSNLSKAANFHYVSIPTFTRHINDLETELSTKLFTRNNRGLTLTAAGALFHSFARDALLQMYHYYVTILDKGYLVGEPHNEFIMGYYAFGGMFPAYAKLIDRYLNLWVKKPCVLHCIRSGEMTEMVRSGLIDVGAVSSSQVEKYGDMFEARTFYKWECQLLVDEEHELASRNSITVDEIMEKYGSFRHYLPESIEKDHAFRYYLPENMVSSDIRDQEIRNAGDIMRLCRMSLELLPLWSSLKEENDEFRPENKLMFMSSMMQRPELKGKHILRIEGANLAMNVCLFWKRDNNSAVIQRFKEALDFAEIK